MREANGVALFSRLNWPKDALGERALLVIESYEPSVWKLDSSNGSVEELTGASQSR
jgi:hypothetical protein